MFTKGGDENSASEETGLAKAKYIFSSAGGNSAKRLTLTRWVKIAAKAAGRR